MTLRCTSRHTDDTPCQEQDPRHTVHHAHDITGANCRQWVDSGDTTTRIPAECDWPPLDEIERRGNESAAKLKARREARFERLVAAFMEDPDDPVLRAAVERHRAKNRRRAEAPVALDAAPGPCPIGPCDWNAEGTLDDHLFCHHGEDEARNALVRLAQENDRLRIALEVAAAEHAKAITARDKAKSRAKISDDIQRAEKQVFDTAIRDLGGEPVQVQNLYAQLNSRTRQWREARQEAESAKTAGYQAAARDATDLLTGHGPDGEMIVSFLQQRGTELHERSATVRPEHDTQEG